MANVGSRNAVFLLLGVGAQMGLPGGWKVSAISKYLAEIGARGGSAKSAAKAEAVRDNLAAARAKRWPKKRKTKKQNVELTFGKPSK